MPSKVLIGWELGNYRGHLVRIQSHKEHLERHGHTVVVVPQNDAPKWKPTGSRISPFSFGDILHRLGGAQPGVFERVMRQWRAIIDYHKPDIIIADFAPGLLCAARHIPTIAYGNGFDTPPAEMAAFPALHGDSSFDHSEVLHQFKQTMDIDRLPEIFTADRTIACVIPEFDPYRDYRESLIPAAMTEIEPLGDEVFVYWQGSPDPQLWSALEATGLPIRTFSSQIMPFAVQESGPVSWPEIARRSRMVVSHGGGGFVTQAVLAGIPQVVRANDLEKMGQAAGVNAMAAGLGLHRRDKITKEMLLGLYEKNGERLSRITGVASDLRSRMTITVEEAMLQAVNDLITEMS